MESADGQKLKEIKEIIIRDITNDLMDKFDKVIENKLDAWKEKTREVCVREIVIEELRKHKLIE